MKKTDVKKLTSHLKVCFKENCKILTLAVVLLMGAFVNVFANDNYSQNTRLNLHLKNATIKSVLQAIELQSEFFFMYTSEMDELNRTVDIDVTNEKVSTVLDKVLENTNIKSVVKDRQIMLVTQKSEELSSQQQKSISGTIKDRSGLPVPGVSVVVKGTMVGTVTDINGKYKIEIPSGATALIFSFIGMQTQEIVIGTQNQISVVMNDSQIGLDEVVIVGYGTQIRANITGAVSTVKSAQLVKAPTVNVSQTLGGRLPGLIAKQGQGAPGLDDAVLSIRGFGAPLVIIDGVEGNFNKLNPTEIESVTILKDASAAIYGSRAGNGVLLVNTKRGKDGKPTISFNYSYTSQSNTTFLKPVSSGQYAELSNEFWKQRGAAGSPPYTQSDVAKFYAGTDPDFPNTNWLDATTRKASPSKQYNLSVSGGNDRVKYYSFFGYLDQQSFFKSNDGNFKRFNARVNLDAKITDNLTASVDISSSLGIRKFPIRAGGAHGAFFADLWNALPIYPASFPDRSKYSFSGNQQQVVALSTRDGAGYLDNNNHNLKGSIALVYNIPYVKGLSVKAFGNYNKDYNFQKEYNRHYDAYLYNNASKTYIFKAKGGGSNLNHIDLQSQDITGQFSLNFDRTFGDHYIAALALYEIIDYSTVTLSAGRQNFLNPDFDYLFGGSTKGMGNNGRATEMGRASYIGRINYAYKSKYLIDATIRRDASAKFPEKTRWGTFPSVSLGWRLSEEGFIKNSIQAVNNLKLRGGFSMTGNDGIGDFQYLSGYVFNDLGMNFGNATQIAIDSKGLANPLLSWEELTIANIGVDFGLWNDKLYGAVDLFTRKREGIAGTKNSSLPNTFGAVAPLENLNDMSNRGYEILLGTKFAAGEVKFDISANLSYTRAKWDYYDEPVYTDIDDIRLKQKTGNYVDRTIGYRADGLFTNQSEIDNLGYNQDGSGNTTLKPGDLKILDLNKDKKIDWRDQDIIGSGATPHYMLGTNIDATYKNFDFSILFQGATGYSVYNNLNPSNDMGSFGNASTALWDNRWTEANNDRYAIVPRIGSNSPTRTYYSDYYLKSGNYVRLKSLTLGYNLPEKWMKSVNLGSARVYFAGTNLFTFDQLKKYGVDPEATASNTNSNEYSEVTNTSLYNIQPQARNGTYYPQQKTFSFGLNLTF